MAEFTIEFNVEDNNKYAYRDFIQNLRQRLADPGSFSHNLPVLPRQEPTPTRWFDIVLRTRSQALRLRIRSDNLYLDGFREENSDQWYEFSTRSSTTHLIPDSIFLGFDGGYNSLENAASRRRVDIDLGQQQFITAVNQLATSDDRRERARQLIVVIQMICESIRFAFVSDRLTETWSSSSPPPSQMIALENGWGDLSAALLHADQDPGAHRFRLPQPNDMQIVTAADAAAVLGILLRYAISRPSGSRIVRAAAAPFDYPEGSALVEVYWVRINNIDGEDPGHLYGTIRAVDGLGSQDIYNRNSGNYEYIHAGELAMLTGPSRPISAAGDFIIDLDLWDKDSLSPDDKIAQGQISWNRYDPGNEYDRSITQEIRGDYGSASVHYAVLSNAARARVEIVLINGDGEDPANVYGNITAKNGVGDSELELFRTPRDKYVNVSPNSPIPLLRSAVAVPLDSSLVIKALLYDSDSLSPDDEIANGTAEIPVALLHSNSASIAGAYGEISVRVSWESEE